jgi:hypothetical protein
MRKETSKVHMLLVVSFCCLAAAGSRVLPAHAAEDGSFAGTLVANGSKEVLALGSERETALFRLSGVVHLTRKIGRTGDYWSECIGLADTETGSDIRCVWRSLEGDEIYLTLKGIRMKSGSSITGNFVGGAGAAKGITGTLRFTWSMMSFQQETKEMGIGGFSNDLSGTYQIP